MEKILHSIKSNLELWPLMTFIVFLNGFLGFYTYCNLNNIAFPQPDLSLIIGIGLYNITIAGILIFAAYRKREPLWIVSLGTYFIISSMTSDPTKLAIILIIYLQLYVFEETFFNNKKRVSFSKKRTIVENRFLRNMRIDIFAAILALILTLFVDSSIWYKVIIVHFVILTYHRMVKKWRNNIVRIFLVTLIIPLLTSANFLSNINHTLFGLSQQYVNVNVKGSPAISGIITYMNSNDIFVKTDTTFLTIPKHEIIKIQKVDTSNFSPETGIEFVIGKYLDFKEYLQ